MSTFSGFVSEIPGISVDRFLERNRRQSTVFLLSHCHSDHMVGLDFRENLPGPLYASPISTVFLKHRFPQLSGNIRSLEIGEPTVISLKTENNTRQLQVTAIPAGHCPGSVMFLFENENQQQVLYTGDFRISAKDLRNIKALRSLSLNSIYLDTTFFNPNYNYFPAQADSLARLVTLCSEWLSLDDRNVISIKLPALIGSEFLFMELSRQLKQKVHVQQKEWQQYRYLACLDESITPDSSAARIHACLGTSFRQDVGKLPCKPELDCNRHVRVIRPSALRWQKLAVGDPYWKRLRKDREEYAVCYSNHASYEELEDFLRYLRPKRVIFCVLPKHDPDGERMNLLLGNILGVEERTVVGEDMNENVLLSFKGIVYRQPDRSSKQMLSDDDSGEEDTVIHHLPKRYRKELS
ncbi:protein artemis-like [Topomyia yanbarensis]|uniref:protein artemis-like n=1 Tax=Topomyia yanbarensis TaxID=2498891 RepID=UPI00273BD77D|nr:protein artemis-like [Topomyia yanbarensis]XP_058834774.1 protein artemis-like [Topomyia yanbarensis]